MRHIRVSLYTREPITRRYKLVPQRNKPDYPSTTTFVLRYGSTWETLKVNSLPAATDQKIQRELALLRGWVPTAKPKPESKSKVLMLDQAIDQYLAEIKTGRKPKTYAAYHVSLRYFFESTKNKPLNQIVRTDLIDFVPFSACR